MEYLTFILMIFIGSAASAQKIMAPRHLLIEKDSTFLLVDDTPGCWYTLELKADKMGLIDENLYYFDHKTIQFGGYMFDTGRPAGVMESRGAEVNALNAHMKFELKQYLNSEQSKLYYNKKLYLNNSGKPFLIWWFKVPEIKTTGHRKKADETNDTGKKAIFQLYLDCITQAN